MKKIAPRPVENGHKVVANHLYAVLGKVANGLLVIFNIHIARRQTNFYIVVNVYRFYDVDIETVLITLSFDFCDFRFFPDFTGHLIMQSPNNAFYTGDLFYIR